VPLLILFAEILLIYYFVVGFGFLNFILFYMATSVLGILIVRFVGSKTLRDFQTGQSAMPNKSVISRGLLFLSGLMLIVPSMGTKIFGALLIIPPVRWIGAAVFSNFLVKRVFNANSFVHQFGNGGFKFYYQGPQQNPFQNQNIHDDSAESGDVIDANFRKIDETKLIK
jgi:UPF0716 family protein affecting phage T7 exclusion